VFQTLERSPLGKFIGMLGIGSPAWHSFHPFGDVIRSNQDILVVMGLGKGSHVVNAPYIEEFHLKIIC
jgi:hypothetical protein